MLIYQNYPSPDQLNKLARFRRSHPNLAEPNELAYCAGKVFNGFHFT